MKTDPKCAQWHPGRPALSGCGAAHCGPVFACQRHADQALRTDAPGDVLVAACPQEQAKRCPTVASRAAYLLVVAVDRLGEACVYDRTDVRNVYSQSEGGGSY